MSRRDDLLTEMRTVLASTSPADRPVQEYLLARYLQVREEASSYVPDTSKLSKPPPRGLPLLESQLGDIGVEILAVTRGRPTTLRLRCPNGVVLIGEEEAEVAITPDAMPYAALLVAAERSSGNAVFNISGLGPAKRKGRLAKALQPQIYFMTLLSEQRIWTATRWWLDRCHDRVWNGKEVLRVSKGTRRGSIRLIHPQARTGLDFEEMVHVQQGPKR